MSSEHLLKVLSGNHQGAEVILGNEAVVIGSGEDSDIVLTDSMIKEHHTKITFSDGTTVIQPMDGQVYVDGKLIKEAEQSVSDFQFITIGSTHIIFGPANEPWPNLSVNDAPTLESVNEVKIAEEGETVDQQPDTSDVNEDTIVQKSSIKVDIPNGHG